MSPEHLTKQALARTSPDTTGDNAAAPYLSQGSEPVSVRVLEVAGLSFPTCGRTPARNTSFDQISIGRVHKPQ